MSWSQRTGPRRVGGAEKGYDWRTYRSSEMHDASIVTDHEFALSNERCSLQYVSLSSEILATILFTNSTYR